MVLAGVKLGERYLIESMGAFDSSDSSDSDSSGESRSSPGSGALGRVSEHHPLGTSTRRGHLPGGFGIGNSATPIDSIQLDMPGPRPTADG